MPLGDFGSIPSPDITHPQLVNEYAKLQRWVEYLLNGGLDTLNVLELSADVINAGILNAGLVTVRANYEGGAFIELSANGIKINDGAKDTFVADTTGFVTMTGGLVQSVAGTYPNVQFNGVGNIFQASKTAVEYIAISPGATGSPTLLFESPSVKAFISATELLGYLWINATVGNVYIQSQLGDINLLPEGYVKLSSWGKLLNTGTNRTLLDVINDLQAQLNSKQNTLTDGDVVIIDDELFLNGTGVGAGTYTKVTVRSDGRVYSGSNLIASDIPILPQSKINNLTSDLASKATVMSGGTRFQSGQTAQQSASSSVITVNITFDAPFSSTPKVVASLDDGNTSTFRVWTANASSTGFTIYFSGSTGLSSAQWIAIGN